MGAMKANTWIDHVQKKQKEIWCNTISLSIIQCSTWCCCGCHCRRQRVESDSIPSGDNFDLIGGLTNAVAYFSWEEGKLNQTEHLVAKEGTLNGRSRLRKKGK